jgi:eukaryotic-like serine/threonine-protein kinase
MGLARSDRYDINQDMTASGVTLGTFDYISPEQAKDPRDADLRSDLYSLGCTFYFMLTGSPPYPGGTMLQKLLAHGSDPLPDIRRRRPEVSDHLSNVLKRMLAKQPSDRYQDSESLVADLKRVAVLDGLRRSRNAGPNVFAPTNPIAPLVQRHLPWIAAATVLLVVGAFLQIQGIIEEQNLTIPQSASPPTLVIASPSNAIREPGSSTTTQPTESLVPDNSTNPSDDTANPSIFSSSQVPTPLKGTTAPTSNNTSREPIAGPAVDLHTAFTAGKVRSLLVLGDRMPRKIEVDSDGRFPLATLQEAFDAAAEHRIAVIEIGVPELTSPPVQIRTRDVVVRSALAQSVIQWEASQSSPTASGSTPSVAMAEVYANKIEFENLNLVWNVPENMESGSTLFRLVENQVFRLNRCVVTIANRTKNPITAFQIASQESLVATTAAASIRDILPTTQLKLSNVIVRGEVSMIQLKDQSSFDLDWNNGWLAVSGCMIESNGSPSPPEQNGAISISFDQVVVDAQEGLVVTQATEENTPIAVSRTATKSVFVIPPQKPLIDFAGLEQLGRNGQWLRLQGTSNAYDSEPGSNDSLLRLITKDEIMQTIQINELVSGRSPWIQEALPRLTVSWDRVRRPTETASQRMGSQYRVVQTSTPVGFEESLLPNIDLSLSESIENDFLGTKNDPQFDN